MGATGGLALAWLGIHELLTIAPANLPRLDVIRIDSTVLVFTVVASLLAAATFGMASAWRASRPNVMNVLRGSSRNEGLASGGLLRKLAVTAEVALSFVLLVGSGLMFRSFLELQRIDPGFDPDARAYAVIHSGSIIVDLQTRPNMTLTAIAARLRKVAADRELLAAKGRSACLAGRDHKLACFQFLWGEFPSIPNGSASYFSVAYSDFAASRMGRSGSASFQAAKKSW
jgi:hypothetical protein